MNIIPEWADVFDRQVSKNTTSELEIAAHYQANPERWRCFVDGTRQFIQYNDIPQYTHTGSDHELAPNAGETIVFETTERPRYTVQYELAATWAASVNQELQSGDRVRVGLYDGVDGWYFEQTGDHNPGMGDFVVESGGVVQERTTEDINAALTEFARFFLGTGWYRVTRQRWERSYPKSGYQQNPEIARTGDVDVDGPEVGNLPLRFEVTAGGATSNLALTAGSCALVTYGGVSDRVREKTHSFEYTFNTTDSWVPVAAMRVDPNRSITSVQVANTDIVRFTGSGNVRVMPIAVAPSKTDASAWQTPVEQSPGNSVVEIAGSRDTANVSTFPDQSGGVVSSASNPGGYQLGYSSWYSSGTGSKTSVSSGAKTRKREISSRDVCVFIGNASATGSITAEVVTEQDW